MDINSSLRKFYGLFQQTLTDLRCNRAAAGGIIGSEVGSSVGENAVEAAYK